MLKKLRLNNFQRIKSLEFDLDTVTAIVGESEVGKSCAFRGLESMILNAKGNKFITKGASSCSVYAETEVGSVEWIKKKTGSATYKVDYKGRQEVFEKCETIPELACKVLGICEVEFGDIRKMVSLQGQFEPPFLLFESGTTVAKVLGKFTKLDEIYAAVRRANRDNLNIKQELGVRESDLEAAEERVKKHEGLEKLETLVKVLDKSAEDLKEKEKERVELNGYLTELDGIRASISGLDISGVVGLVDGWPDEELAAKVKELQSHKADLLEAGKVLATLVDLDWQLGRAVGSKQDAETKLETFKRENKLCPACGRTWDA